MIIIKKKNELTRDLLSFFLDDKEKLGRYK